MNKLEAEILTRIEGHPGIDQRSLAKELGYSLGSVNQALQSLQTMQYVDNSHLPTEKAEEYIQENSPKRAVILCAGFGMRMVPINTEIPKGLLEIHGEKLVERLIRQLHEAGIYEIYLVVGFMKEAFEYLIDLYGVQLIVNPDYAGKNNLHSVYHAVKHLENGYVLPCDLFFRHNPFRYRELYSWYAVTDRMTPDSHLRINRSRHLAGTRKDEEGNRLIGAVYLTKDTAHSVQSRILELAEDHAYDEAFWESALMHGDKCILEPRVFPDHEVIEINTYEELRDVDCNPDQLQSDAITIISEALHVHPNEITNIRVLKKGMTNRSFLFECNGKHYIMRIPGEGTDLLINRKEEADVYRTIMSCGISDTILYINEYNGYKITEFIENARTCNAEDPEDIAKCFTVLKKLHAMNLQVPHTFDIFKKTEEYESFYAGHPSLYKDHDKTKERVLSLKPYIDSHITRWCLTHIDANCDNFLMYEKDGKEQIRLIDWEYAGMQDPDLDIAMFCIYSLFDKEQIDRAIDIYYDNACDQETRIKIYCYVAAAGLLWSDWCEYKYNLGIEFGEYSLRQYRYAKEYSRLALQEMENLG